MQNVLYRVMFMVHALVVGHLILDHRQNILLNLNQHLRTSRNIGLAIGDGR